MSIIEKLNVRIAQELEPIDTGASYDQMLDDYFSFEKVGGPFSCMRPSLVLHAFGRTDYRCGHNDHINTQDWVDVGSKYYTADEVERVKSALIAELEEEAGTLNTELVQGDHDYDEDRATIARITKDITTLNAHSF